ncbi:MAG: nuclear transport factor 2 family protein [Candidatus Acidiferrum sp.]|jgi:ketosteroid isomerase-like protein
MKVRMLGGFLSGVIALLLLLTELPRSLTADTSPREAMTSVLTEQQSAWNRGDVNAFMKGYWDSPELTFAGTSGITRGWQPVLARYQKNYPDQKAMGHLDFSDVEVRPLGNDAALVLGRWHLQRDTGELGGVFTLVFQRFPEGWKIIHDHTSLDAKKP